METKFDEDIRIKIVPIRRGTRFMAIAEHWDTGAKGYSLPCETRMQAEKEAREALGKLLRNASDVGQGSVDRHTS